ncbi:hypothetical protein [Agrobacterium vitis]|nr:hypothetical protein [Agrobacterium vitis]
MPVVRACCILPPPGEMSQGDLETARLYGVRVAEIASRFATTQTA